MGRWDVHLRRPADVQAMMTNAAGMELVLDKQQVRAQSQLPLDREGDFAVLRDRNTVVGARPEDHDLSQFEGVAFAPMAVSENRRFLLSRPLNAAYRGRAKDGSLHNYDIFHFALNGVE
jgi:phosphonoacetate hydrolase